LEGTNESDPKKFLYKFDEKMKCHLKAYEDQKLESKDKEGKIEPKNKSEDEKIKYIKQHEFFKKNKIINDPLLSEFIIENLSQIITNSLNGQEVIRTYLSQKIIYHIIETIKYYNLIIAKDMKEINKNKQVIGDSILEVADLEEKEKKLKTNNRELKYKLNEMKMELEKQINKHKEYVDSINNNNKGEQELLKQLKEENEKLYDKIEDKKNEIKTLQKDLDNLEGKYENIQFCNSMLISNESVNGILFDDYMNSIKNLNGEINELNGKMQNINNDNIELKQKIEELLEDNSHMKNELVKISK
jgi:predicted RNase H-like nuclease (RuvC/YqgF family)